MEISPNKDPFGKSLVSLLNTEDDDSFPAKFRERRKSLSKDAMEEGTLFAAKNGMSAKLAVIAEEGGDFLSHNDSYPLRTAADRGHLECVKILMPHSEHEKKDHYALRWAAIGGFKDCVEYLVGFLDDARPVIEMMRRNEVEIAGAGLIESVVQSRALLGKNGGRANDRSLGKTL